LIRDANMELRQIRHFLAAVEARQFTRAAERMNIVQSALSTSILALEREVGSRLLIRDRRGLRLTQAGEVFLRKAKLGAQLIAEAADAVAEVEGLKRGVLTIGSVQSVASFIDLPRVFARFNSAYPGIEVRLRQGRLEDVVDDIRARRLDLGLLPILEPLKNVGMVTIVEEPLMLACPHGSGFALRRATSIEDLAGEAFIDFQPRWGTRPVVDRVFAEAQVERRVQFEINEIDAMLEMVALGLGLAIVPRSVIEARRDTVAMVPLQGRAPFWRMAAVFLDGDGPDDRPVDAAPRAFVDALRDLDGVPPRDSDDGSEA